MAITIEGVHDLGDWAVSKACNGWRNDRRCRDNRSNEVLPAPHEGCVQAQRACDLLSAVRRHDGADVVGWLVTDDAIDPALW